LPKYYKIGGKNQLNFLIACLLRRPNNYFRSAQNSNDLSP
jgi:hypothetical protein